MKRLLEISTVLTILLLIFFSCDPQSSQGDSSSTRILGIDREISTLIVTVNVEEGILIRVTAHTQEDFSDEGILVEAQGTGSTQNIAIPGLKEDTNYYIQIQGEGETSGSQFTERAPDNPYMPEPEPPDPSVSILGMEQGAHALAAVVNALPDVQITLSVHTDPDFLDPGLSQTITSTGVPQVIAIKGLVNDQEYYVQSQGENAVGDLSVWVEEVDNPHTPIVPETYISDLIPESSRITVSVETADGADAVMEMSMDKDFAVIEHTESIAGDGISQTVILSGLVDDQPYYFRIKEENKIHWETYSTPGIPLPAGKQYIHTLKELAKIGKDTENYPQNWVYELKANLNFADANNDGFEGDPFDTDDNPDNGNWDSPMWYSDMNEEFLGTFDGGGFTVDGMRMTFIRQNMGLFGVLGDGATVQNLGNTNIYIESNHSKIGGIAGVMFANSSVINSYVTGHIKEGYLVGGITGKNSGSILNSYTDCLLENAATSGGIAGSSESAGNTISNTYVLGDNIGSSSPKGGLVGQTKDGTIVNNYVLGKVVSDSQSLLGGFIGEIISGVAIQNNFVVGDVSGPSGSGGIGNLAGSLAPNSGWSNNYYYSGQTVTNGDEVLGDPVSSVLLKTKSWYTDAAGLNWGEGTPGNAQWHISGPVDSGAFPHVNRSGVTSDTVSSEVSGQQNVSIP